MRPPERVFRIAAGDVLSKIVDGEAIAIDMRTGSYHAMPGTASLLWHRLATGADAGVLAALLIERFAVATDVAHTDVAAFLQALEKAGLIVEATRDAAADPAPQQPAPAQAEAAPAAYAPPRLETYTDMQDFLLVDPIHEVDERGWPHPADPRKA